MRIARTAFAVLFVMMVAAPLARAEQVDNPAYEAWAKFGVGSSETLHSSMQAGGQSMEMESTRTLKEKTDDHLVITVQATMNMMGQQHTTPERTMTIPAKTQKKDVKELGTEDVQAAGQTFSCKVFEVKGINPQEPGAFAKIWVSPEVPGGVVKMQAGSPRGTITSTLKSYDKK